MPTFRFAITSSLAFMLCGICECHAEIYFTTSSSGPPIGTSLAVVAEDGSNAHGLLNLGGPGRSLAVDAANGKVYFAFETSSGGRLAKSNLDGSSLQILITTGFNDFELDLTAGKIYLSAGAEILRSNLDGSGYQSIYQNPPLSFWGIALDHATNSIFIGDTYTNSIIRTDLDGQNPTTLIQFSQNVDLQELEVDSVHGKLYWVDKLLNKIQRSNLDGTMIEDVLLDGSARRLAIDPFEGKIIFGSTGISGFGPGLFRANLNGSNLELILADPTINDIHGLDFGPVATGVQVTEPTSIVLFCIMICTVAGAYSPRRVRAE